ncbi:MAG: hypothetical protein AAB948_04155 [Patescibacteria group bacterium]
MAQNQNNKNEIYTWSTQEFDHYEKGTGWYLTFSIIALLLVGYEVYMRDWMAALTIIVAIIAIYFFSKQQPREIDIVITDKGINVANVYFPYHNIKRFWIIYHQQAQQLHFETTAYLNRFVIVPLNGINPTEVSDILKKHLPESTPNRETVAQRLARWLRF